MSITRGVLHPPPHRQWDEEVAGDDRHRVVPGTPDQHPGEHASCGCKRNDQRRDEQAISAQRDAGIVEGGDSPRDSRQTVGQPSHGSGTTSNCRRSAAANAITFTTSQAGHHLPSAWRMPVRCPLLASATSPA